MTTLTIKDYIAHLQTLDQSLEVWTTWDESGECFPMLALCGEVWTVRETVGYGRKEKRWEKLYADDKPEAQDKTVFMVNA